MADAPLVKICGLTRPEDAEAADGLGADFLGAVLSSGYHRSVPVDMARSLFSGRTASGVAVLVDEAPESAARLADGVGAGVVQLHGHEGPGDVERLRALGPWRIWKAVRAAEASDVARAVELYGALVDGILVEGVKAGVVGGGGARLDAASVGRVRDLIPARLDFVLAGGLTPDSVAEAVDLLSPDVVDVSSGVEVDRGRKDPVLVERFLRAARGVPRSDVPRPRSGDPS